MGLDERRPERDPLARDGIVLADGFRLLPRLVHPYLADPRHAVWLAPTPAFRRAAFARREAHLAFWPRTSDPPRALAGLLERDRLFTDAMTADAARCGAEIVAVDGSCSNEEAADALAARSGLPFQ